MRERVPGGQVALQGRAARHGGCEYRAAVLRVLHGVAAYIEMIYMRAYTHMRASYIDASTHICTRALVG